MDDLERKIKESKNRIEDYAKRFEIYDALNKIKENNSVPFQSDILLHPM